ncbi:XRE family transcriptional regulator [Longispora fulva]|uniref:Putative ATPase/DNA-binding XRE family transcriptional regulator n=2 Tax=Longispora fulva TaxID=619741 RepID=A0A8J7GKY4_9ACTN|nr:helix-turn-helix domain-containing protein [Longispora fulva]MBG6139585.1 putative ATPase/DNA-binding XRE family transcriptional regulator [Longispora fulva]GIG58032.1 XRE family transcriptional regulator [Longispora fulva]
MTFAERLKVLRRAAGLTQVELATRARVGIRTLRDIERGHVARPQRATVELLADALGLEGVERVEFDAAARGQAVVVQGADRSLPPVQPLIGRDAAIVELGDLLVVADMVTLVGVAGVGKSSLALAAAHRVADRYPGGVACVPVTDAAGDADVLAAIAAAYQVVRIEELPEQFGGRPALLVLDAVERSPAAVVAALRTLRRYVPGIRILATGRHPLGVTGEYQRPLQPLEPQPAALLFLDRLRRVRAHEVSDDERDALAELVERLGGLPYALELAAARGRVLSVVEILARYGSRVLDLGAGLRAAVASSYQLLDEQERHALRLLSTFAGRWSMELAEALAETDIVPTVDRLASLGLVILLPGTDLRFRLLDVVRDYAIECTPPDEVLVLRARHAALIADQVVALSVGLTGPGQKTAITRLSDIYSEIRYALVWASGEDPCAALRIAARLPRYWRARGRSEEGEAVLTGLLADPRVADVDRLTWAWATLGVVMLAHEPGRASAGLPTLEAAIAVFVEAGDPAGELQAHGMAAGVCQALGDHAGAYHHAHAAVGVAQRTGRPRDAVVAQNNLFWHDIRAGDLAAGRSRLEAAERLARQIEDARLIVIVRINLAEVARLDMRYPDAILIARQAMPLLVDLGEPGLHLRLLCTAALAYAQDGRLADAVAVLADLRARPGYETNRAVRGLCTSVEGYVALHRGDRVLAALRFAAAVEQLTEQHDARDALEALVGLAVSTDDAAERSDALTRLERLRTVLAMNLVPREQQALTRLL